MRATAVDLETPRWPAPLHLVKGLLGARGLGMGERLAAAGFMRTLGKRGYDLPDAPLGTLLDAHGQPPGVTRALWEPLCLATLNTPLAIASARLFARVLQRSFAGRPYDHALLDDLPPGVDPCGENGEFHTCVVSAPAFRAPLSVQIGQTVERDGFIFTDLLGEHASGP